MNLIDEQNAGQYLRGLGWIGADEPIAVRALAGGVSNQVLYVSRPARRGEDFVLKQARAQLRTPDPWFSRLERVWREVEVLRICQDVLDDRADREAAVRGEPEAWTPRILHEDRENYAFAMTAAPPNHQVWKAVLLAGRTEPAIAGACGRLLGRLHARTWSSPEIAQRLDDRSIFDELRLDPYYRALARACPDAAAALDRLVSSVWQHRRSLVHADFSPKNLLVYDGGLLLVDFETGHYGDPAFDLGFFLSHLVLKAAFHAPRHEACLQLTERFWQAYRRQLMGVIGDAEWAALEGRAVQNLAGCAWARLDGTSKIDYLSDPRRRDTVRALCRRILDHPPAHWDEVLALCRLRFPLDCGAH